MKCAYPLCKDLIKIPQKCPKCKAVSYCCTSCRTQDWYKFHQKLCGVTQQVEEKIPENVPNNSLNRYEDMKQVLGSGSYGEVKLVKNKTTNKLHAMKIVNKKSVEQEASLDIIIREISVHKELNHPNIIKLNDSFEDREFIYLIIEYAESGSLFQQVHEGQKLSEETARKYFLQTIIGIMYLHENHIVHRDIKPENILIDKNDNVKICDFGWCVKGEEMRSTFCGTLDYMAPEMIKGQKHSFEVDIWALGVLLYEILHGYSPFEALKEADKCQNIANAKFIFEKSISENAKDLITKMIQIQPNNRIKLNEALTHPFFAVTVNNSSLQIGAAFRSYVQNYGMDEGIVEEIKGNECTVLFKKSGTRDVMNIDEVDRRVKRGKLMGKKESVVEENKETQKIDDEAKSKNIGKVSKIIEKYEAKGGANEEGKKAAESRNGNAPKIAEKNKGIENKDEGVSKVSEKINAIEKKNENLTKIVEKIKFIDNKDEDVSKIAEKIKAIERKNESPAKIPEKFKGIESKNESVSKIAEKYEKNIRKPEETSKKNLDKSMSIEKIHIPVDIHRNAASASPNKAFKHINKSESKETIKTSPEKPKKNRDYYSSDSEKEDFSQKNGATLNKLINNEQQINPIDDPVMKLFSQKFSELEKEEEEEEEEEGKKEEINEKYIKETSFTSTISINRENEPINNRKIEQKKEEKKKNLSEDKPEEEKDTKKRLDDQTLENKIEKHSKEDNIFNNLDAWIKAPIRKKKANNNNFIQNRPRDKSLDKSIDRFKEQFLDKPQDQLIENKSKNVEIENSEEAPENIYKKKILENIKKAEDDPKIIITKPKEANDFSGVSKTQNKVKEKKIPNEKISAENVFKINPENKKEANGEMFKKNKEKSNSPPHFGRHQKSDINEDSSFVITQDIHNQACNLFDEIEKISVSESIKRTSSPRIPTSPKKSIRSISPKQHLPFFPDIEKFDPEPKQQKQSIKKGKKGEKLMNFESERELIEQEHENYYSRIEEIWINREDNIIEAPEVFEHEVEINERRNFSEYDKILQSTPSIVSNISDYDKNLYQENAKLNNRKKELEAMIKSLEAQPKSLIKFRKRRQKEKDNGLLHWIGGIIGCSDRY